MDPNYFAGACMSRHLKLFQIIALVLLALPMTTFANEIEKRWNGAVSKQVRNGVSDRLTTTYSETKYNGGPVYSPTDNTVELKRIESKATINGSKGGVTIDGIKVPASTSSAASTWLKRVAKGGVAGVVGGYAIGQLIDSVGWIIDEGGKVIKKPSSTSIGKWSNIGQPELATDDLQAACRIFKEPRQQGATLHIRNDAVPYNGLESKDCWWINNSTGQLVLQHRIVKYQDIPAEPIPITQQDLETAINNAEPPLKKEMIENAYKPSGNNGQSTTRLDDAKSNPDLNSPFNNIMNNFNNAINNNNPITNNNNNSNYNITNPQNINTTYNNQNLVNNYSTTTNTTTTNNTTNETTNTTTVNTPPLEDTDGDGTPDTPKLEIPPFCEWASIMCDWYDHYKEWTKDDIQNEDTEYNFDTDQETADTNIDFVGTCPVLPNASVTVAGVVIQVPISFDKFCELLTFIKPVAILMASLSAVFIVGGRNVPV